MTDVIKIGIAYISLLQQVQEGLCRMIWQMHRVQDRQTSDQNV